MLVRFRGVRGSASRPGPGSPRDGSHTPCLEIRDEATGALLILDAGTGLESLGRSLAGSAPGPVSILLSHFHTDHVQGLRNFFALSKAGWSPAIWAPRFGQNDHRWSEALPSPAIRFIDPGEMEIGGFHIRALMLNHPGGAFAYRIRGAADDLVYMSNHEFGNPVIDEALAPFAVNSGATVVDAYFTPEELPSGAGQGHGTWRQGTEFASATGAGRLWLFQHGPGRTDAQLEEIEMHARRVYPATRVAREGDTVRL